MAESLHTRVLDAIRALPRPITEAAALAAAQALLPRTEAMQFEAWLKKNSAHLLEQFNG